MDAAPARRIAPAADRGLANFRSDTQTRPSRGMLEAALAAETGDEQSGLDPTTRALEETVAALLGKAAAVFLPSGTMCNQIAAVVHCRPGEEVICARASHIVTSEGGGAAALAGVQLHPLDAPRGIFGPEDVAAATRAGGSRHLPRTRLVWAEQTLNMEGGAVWPVARLTAVAEAAKARGLSTHMDGARLLNAAAASGRPAAEHAAGWDSVWIDLSKGLGCPVGAVLAGSEAFVEEAWRIKQRIGGAMRQSGVLAAMGLWALERNVERLAEDHARAARIAEALAGLPGVAEVAPAESNIVIWRLADGAPDAEATAAALEARGVRVHALGPRRMRAVTHLDVGDAETEALIAGLRAELG